MNEVFKIIDEYKEKLENLISEVNKEIRTYKDVYFTLKPKKKTFKEENVLNLTKKLLLREKLTPVMVVAKNYLDSIEKLDEASINEFLDYISIKNNFISIISYMISFANDGRLREYLEGYLKNIINSNMEEKESTEEDNKILYYGFTASKKSIS